jgi:hypothetical protein
VTSVPFLRRASRPRVFIAFKETAPLIRLTEEVKQRLAPAYVHAERLRDNPRPASNLRKRAREAIRDSDGVVLFWSGEAADSEWLTYERRVAHEERKPICLIAFPGVEKPSGWDPDIEWVPLEGVRFTRETIGSTPVPSLLHVLLGGVTISDPAFTRMMRKIIVFAHDAAAGVLPPAGPVEGS